MKYFILSLLIVGCTGKPDDKPSYQERASKAVEFAKALNVGECFRYESDRKAEFSFEKDYRAIGQIHVVMAKDSNGLMIAQPEPNCQHTSDESHKCNYWFRTVAFNNLYLVHDEDRKVNCSSELSVANMIERLKKSEYSNQYNF